MKGYGIFISSTKDDLTEARRQVIDMILKMLHTPVAMEYFGSSDKNSWDVIMGKLSECQYMVTIIGSRYGTEADDGLSITEKEYDYAKSLNIPVLSFVLERDRAVDTSESVSKKRKLNRFIKKVKSSQIEFWKTPEDLAAKVCVSLTNQFRDNPQKKCRNRK